MKVGHFVLGYHGCDESVGEAVLAGRTTLKPSENDSDWLGHGIYFWENNPRRALDWARFMASDPRFSAKVKKPFAIGAVLDLGECLDLTESESLGLVSESYRTFAEALASVGSPLPINKPGSSQDQDLVRRNLDCAVINTLHGLREQAGLPAFDSVRGAFPEGKPLYEGAKIYEKTHIQICIRKQTSIVGYFRIR